MLSLESEYRELHAAGAIDDAVASRGIAAETGTAFSVAEELRAVIYGAVAAIMAGIGIILKTNLQRIGPMSLLIGVAVAAAGCYAPAIRAQLRHATRSTAADYLLLLGALLVSADLGYAESQFHWLGPHWSLHLLILFAVHAATAYAVDSRLVLSLSLTSLAAWFGIEGNVFKIVQEGNALTQSGVRSLVCAGVIYAWREVHRRLRALQPFQETFEHFAANLGFWGAIGLCVGSNTHLVGVICLAVLAAASIRYGLRRAREIFVIYGVGYAALGLICLEMQLITSSLLGAVTQLVTVVAAVMLAWHLHRRVRAMPS